MSRKIIHIDADAFYASVEIRERPELLQRPVAVGGSPRGRGVVATCNYVARSYGIHSAMSSAEALRRCPHLTFIKPRFELYRQVSRQIHRIFADYTDRIEPLSLDEAYLDVSQSDICGGSATRMAMGIRERVHAELGLTVSAGVAPNKSLAKIASDWRKPDGLFVILPEEVEDFLRDLPLRKLHGVGPATAERLQALGLRTCDDLRKWPDHLLQQHLGRYGQRLAILARGLDERPVSTQRIRKSISTETTFNVDLETLQECHDALPGLLDTLRQRARGKLEPEFIRSRFVTVRFNDFTRTTAEAGCREAEPWDSLDAFRDLLQEAWNRGRRPARLLGVGLRLKPPEPSRAIHQQLSLFDP